MELKLHKKSEKLLQAKEKFEENEKLRKVLGWIFQIAVTLVFAAVVAIAMFQSVTMQESSMEPTISVGDRFFMDKVSYKLSSPQRGDIIVFKTNASDDAALHIRRVIGLPGETIQIVDGRILIDGETYREGKDFPSISNPGLAETPITLESGEYFVLGDNRNNSEDSRYGDIGTVKKRYIVGKVWFTISPVSKIGFMRG
ncbi:MAG TPA: signal peptidase I [Candidatus Blautia faecavium]|uniref:Signal peptidase I n=1 Tax=Candidatus Blautia faecavium TaxID=2838487 RepID=A0A9D2LU31_9FIRM|nr:signal peptidase I [Candidatus Blautia faecavium]